MLQYLSWKDCVPWSQFHQQQFSIHQQGTSKDLELGIWLINELHFDFTFNLKDNDDKNQNEKNEPPIYMENSVALMIKKMFCRLKVFTERMT